MLRRLLTAAVLCALAGLLGATRAHAGTPVPVRPALPQSLTSAHFVVHYTGDPTDPAYATQTQAGDLAALAEQARTTEMSWGYNAPPDDGDGHTDIYILDFTPWAGVGGFAVPDGAVVPQSGSIDLAVSQLGAAWEQHLIAHELFHLIQFGYALPVGADHWLLEGEAEWAGYKVAGYSGLAGTTGPPDISLDCYDPIPDSMKCNADGYLNGGYSRWHFYEYLAERFGNAFPKDILVQTNSSGSAFTGLTAALAAKGATFSDVYHDYLVRWMAGGWSVGALDTELPHASGTVVTGTDTADLGTSTYSVDHLAARYVAFTRGDGAGDHPCFAATLTITVGIPAGVAAKPYFYWNQKGSSAVALSVSGSTATATVPWDTCLWAANAGYLVLPNPTTTINAALFTVSAHVTVDPNTPAAATTAPAAQTIYGSTVSVESAQVPPAIALLAPQLLRVSAASPTIHVVVQSSGDGSLQATLGSVSLGSATVRAGNNALQFTVPKGLLTTLRRSAAAGNVLTLTPISPSGTVTGTPVTRDVALQPVAKTKVKAKTPKTKTKAKAPKKKQ
jgi:hypothetical protein